jgi:hypothetical protein
MIGVHTPEFSFEHAPMNVEHAVRNLNVTFPVAIDSKYRIEAARGELLGRGVEISEVFHDAGGVHAGTDKPYLSGRLRVSGPDPEHRSYRSFASFRDPDGNGWLFQEVTTRLPGRIDRAATSFDSASDLASALRRAEAAHGKHEKRIGRQIRTGPTGTPSTWWRSRLGRSCRRERLSIPCASTCRIHLAQTGPIV